MCFCRVAFCSAPRPPQKRTDQFFLYITCITTDAFHGRHGPWGATSSCATSSRAQWGSYTTECNCIFYSTSSIKYTACTVGRPTQRCSHVGGSPPLRQLKRASRGRVGKHSRPTDRAEKSTFYRGLLVRLSLLSLRPRSSTCSYYTPSALFHHLSAAASAAAMLLSHWLPLLVQVLPSLFPCGVLLPTFSVAPLIPSRVCMGRFDTAGYICYLVPGI